RSAEQRLAVQEAAGVLFDAPLIFFDKCAPTRIRLQITVVACFLKRVTHGSCQSVGGIQELRFLIKVKQGFQHGCHLFLTSVSVSCNRLFYFAWSILENGNIKCESGRHGNPLSSSQL